MRGFEGNHTVTLDVACEDDELAIASQNNGSLTSEALGRGTRIVGNQRQVDRQWVVNIRRRNESQLRIADPVHGTPVVDGEV